MKKIIFFLSIIITTMGVNNVYADSLIWSGYVNSRGDQTQPVRLNQGEVYYIIVGGDVNFGRWQQNNHSLLNDACYEYNAKGYPDPLPVFTNNLNISVCDGNYRTNHTYYSLPFATGSNAIFFWVQDTDYNDNRGRFFVQLYRIDNQNDTMARNNCTCEDLDYNGRFSVVINRMVLAPNVGSYDDCIQFSDLLRECRDRPDVMDPNDPPNPPGSSGPPPPSGPILALGNWVLDYGNYEASHGKIEASPTSDGKTSYYTAPSGLHGNWLGNRSLSFSLKSWGGTYAGPDQYGAYGDIVVRNGGKTARFDIGNNHGGGFMSYRVAFNDSRWRLSGGAQSISDVLINVTDLKIRAEYGAGEDYSILQSVSINP